MSSGYHETVNQLLPEFDLIEAGMRDLEAGEETVAALLVSIGAPADRGARTPPVRSAGHRRPTQMQLTLVTTR
jgi:hypothetical protein